MWVWCLPSCHRYCALLEPLSSPNGLVRSRVRPVKEVQRRAWHAGNWMREMEMHYQQVEMGHNSPGAEQPRQEHRQHKTQQKAHQLACCGPPLVKSGGEGHHQKHAGEASNDVLKGHWVVASDPILLVKCFCWPRREAAHGGFVVVVGEEVLQKCEHRYQPHFCRDIFTCEIALLLTAQCSLATVDIYWHLSNTLLVNLSNIFYKTYR
ncbi:hypothetical protein AC578_8320 [Pseudocercospora eumusae]|uniref:Uncharacterized protein n=1 Tax=Pseudocercospora eumusae TaxID=321146 RepID=A0A139H2V4_9PEZI|nr:hypothetical protein AC578_8320 [Pseudocercospora eumusae]